MGAERVVTEPNAFTGAPLDRVADERKDPAWVAAQREHPHARALLAGDAGVHVLTGDPARLALVPLHEAPAAEPILLGLDATGPVFVVDTDPAGEPPPALVGSHTVKAPHGAPTRPVGLRDVVGELPREAGGLVAYAASLVNWHRRNGFCSVCGVATEPTAGGLVRDCPNCGTHHFPRTDPVVIMAIHDGGDRLLLGRQPSWP